jgi:hypothetical protein
MVRRQPDGSSLQLLPAGYTQGQLLPQQGAGLVINAHPALQIQLCAHQQQERTNAAAGGATSAGAHQLAPHD